MRRRQGAGQAADGDSRPARMQGLGDKRRPSAAGKRPTGSVCGREAAQQAELLPEAAQQAELSVDLTIF